MEMCSECRVVVSQTYPDQGRVLCYECFHRTRRMEQPRRVYWSLGAISLALGALSSIFNPCLSTSLATFMLGVYTLTYPNEYSARSKSELKSSPGPAVLVILAWAAGAAGIYQKALHIEV